jgi:hypothetical protein
MAGRLEETTGMAIRPRVTPKWATSSYGNDDVAWEEAKRECRTVLYEWCARKELHSCVELINQVTEIPRPPGDHSSGQLGYLLGQVSLEELDPAADRPVISSVVVASGRTSPPTDTGRFSLMISVSTWQPLSAKPSG